VFCCNRVPEESRSHFLSFRMEVQCDGCKSTFCKTMCVLRIVKNQALKLFSPPVHNLPLFVAKNSECIMHYTRCTRNTHCYRLSRKHLTVVVCMPGSVFRPWTVLSSSSSHLSLYSKSRETSGGNGLSLLFHFPIPTL